MSYRTSSTMRSMWDSRHRARSALCGLHTVVQTVVQTVVHIVYISMYAQLNEQSPTGHYNVTHFPITMCVNIRLSYVTNLCAAAVNAHRRRVYHTAGWSRYCDSHKFRIDNARCTQYEHQELQNQRRRDLPCSSELVSAQQQWWECKEFANVCLKRLH